jgi:prevent-host-death family protein
MAKILSLSEVKTRLPELVAGVQEREEEVIVTKNGRPAAILINVDEYTRPQRDRGCPERSWPHEPDRREPGLLQNETQRALV